jgi:hypothetical protein
MDWQQLTVITAKGGGLHPNMKIALGSAWRSRFFAIALLWARTRLSWS